jgi:hypothetical protein
MGDDVLEIMCARWIIDGGVHLQHGDTVEVEFLVIERLELSTELLLD